MKCAKLQVSKCQLITLPEPGNSPEAIAEAKMLGGAVNKLALGVIALAGVPLYLFIIFLSFFLSFFRG